MSISYSVSETGRRVDAYSRRARVALEDVLAYFEQLRNDPRVAPGAVEVVHFDGLQDVLVFSRESEQIAKAFKTVQRERGFSGTVFVGTSDFAFGMGRHMQSYLEIHLPGYPVAVVRGDDAGDVAAGQMPIDDEIA